MAMALPCVLGVVQQRPGLGRPTLPMLHELLPCVASTVFIHTTKTILLLCQQSPGVFLFFIFISSLHFNK
jgi:hypothetical protein